MKFVSRRTTLTCIAALIAGAVHSSASEQKGVCWPLNFAGITLGINTDAQAVRLLGTGLFRPSEGDTGGRLWTDKKHTASLHAVAYTDRIIGELTLSALPDNLSAAGKSKAESSFLDPMEGFGNWHQLHLGSTEQEVRNNLGEPESKEKDGGWRYPTTCSCEIEDFLTIYFKDSKINKVIFSAPAG